MEPNRLFLSCPLQVVCRATVALWHYFSLLTWALQKFLSFQQLSLSQLPCQAAKQSVPLVVHFLFLLGFFFGSGYGCSVCSFWTCLLCCGVKRLQAAWQASFSLVFEDHSRHFYLHAVVLLDKQLILVRPHSAPFHVSRVYLVLCFIRASPYHFVVPGNLGSLPGRYAY